MMRPKYLWGLILFSLASLPLGSGVCPETGMLEKIRVHDGKYSARILIISEQPLVLFGYGYAKDQPSTLIIEAQGELLDFEPQITIDPVSQVKGIKVEQAGPETIRILATLKQRVPYRIYAQKTDTIVELSPPLPAEADVSPDKKLTEKINRLGGQTQVLNQVDITDTGDRIDITAKTSEEPVSNVFALDNPLRLVVDLYNTIHNRVRSAWDVGRYGVLEVRASQFQVSNPYTITRLVVELTEPKFFKLESRKDSLTVSFFKDDVTEVKPFPREEKELSETSVPPDGVRDIKLQPSVTSAAFKEIQKDKDKGKMSPPETSGGKQAILEGQIKESEKKNLSKAQEQKAEESSPPLTQVQVQKTEQKKLSEAAEKAAQASAKVPEEVFGEEAGQTQFTPRTLAETEQKYTGDLISPRFKDADLRDVILYLGDTFGFNVVFDPEVRGSVTCDFKDIPWDQFVDIILKVNRMGKVIEGNVLRVAPIDVLTREQESQRKLDETKELAGPILTKSFTLSYSKAADVQLLLQTKISDRGEMIVDGRTNTLIISDVKDRLELIERLIQDIDIANPQVSIEARVVEANSTYVRNLGIQWGWRGIADPFYGNQTSLQFPNKILSDGSLIPQGIVTRGIGGPLGGYAVNLPAPAFSTAVGLSLSNVLDTFRIDMAISALETSGNGRIISSPNIVTQNNTPAEIIQGRQIPVQTAANFTVTTRYQNAALELKATPQITAEGTIIMILEIKNDAPDFANLVNGIPPITTQSAKTTVEIRDGGTTVIGGIYRTEDSITRERVPFFHKIPILGSLFRSFSRTRQNRELLIFITPRIIK